MSGSPASGSLLREWRTRRRYSQLELALRADVSSKHLSYVETGRARPSPEMIVHLCEHLQVPLRSRNEILLAAGHAPRYGDSGYSDTDHGELRAAVDQVVAAHRDPVLVVDRHWDLITANTAAGIFLTGLPERLLMPPVNVVRLSLDPSGLAARITNFADYAAHVIQRVRRLHDHHPSPVLQSLLDDFAKLDDPAGRHRRGILLPLHLTTPVGELHLFSTITTFGTPQDATLEELAIETFHPADDNSRRLLDELLAASGAGSAAGIGC